jgi:UDP-GlcNAc:undecaprenyl-phosphate/decaprenyl-phosphate GlcNAc-1-phosphate transferase
LNVTLSLLAGMAAGVSCWLALRSSFENDVFRRENYRRHSLPTAAGIVVVLAALGGEAVRAVIHAAGPGAGWSGVSVLVLATALGLGLLGAVDDLAGATHARGFRGHLRALASGELTTGMVKLLGGGAVAVVVVAPVSPGLADLVVDAVLVALAANLGNLFDRAPGRVIKVATLAFVVLVAATGAAAELAPVAVVVGAGLGLLVPDLREQLMVGDAGANVLGGVIGLGAVLTLSPAGRVGVLVAFAALNLASEVVSFSRVIDGFPPLRALDRAGGTPERRGA